jgi:iron-sulfur cluster assembly protein
MSTNNKLNIQEIQVECIKPTGLGDDTERINLMLTVVRGPRGRRKLLGEAFTRQIYQPIVHFKCYDDDDDVDRLFQRFLGQLVYRGYTIDDLSQRARPRRTHRMIDHQPTVVSLTDAAASKLRDLTKDEANPDIGLRVYVYSGGCSGYRYGMMLEDAPTAEDNRLEVNGIKVYVDGQSISLLEGSQIDYVDTLMGAGFTVNNPNAVAACGCGSSFRTADDEGAPRACAH